MSMVEKLQQEDYEQQFNDFCAKMVGMEAGNGCTDQIYFKDDGMRGTYECRIEDYVPYTSIDQLEPVIEILKSTLGFTVDLETQRREGVLVAYRSMVDDMLDAVVDCDNHPYETCAERQDAIEEQECSIEENIKHKLVNSFCAKTMGYTHGVLGAEDVYFDEDGGVICNYNAYDDLNKLAPVIDTLASGLNVFPNRITISNKGHLEAFRELILDNIISDEDKDELCGVDELVCGTLKEQIIDNTLAELREKASESFNNTMAFADACKNWSNIDDEMLPDASILDVEEGWVEYDRKMEEAVGVSHGMYDDDLQGALRENTKRQFEHSLRLNMPYGENGTVSKEVIKGCVGQERFWEDEDIPCVDNDEYDFTHIGNPKHLGWQAARILVLANYNDSTSFDVEEEYGGRYYLLPRTDTPEGIPSCVMPFSYTVDGFAQFAAIERYLRDPANGLGLWETEEDRLTLIPCTGLMEGAEIAYVYRQDILAKCLGKLSEEYRTDKEVFNELCQRITKTANAPGYCIDTSTFNPYQDLQQLTRIVEIVIGATFEPFVISIEGSGGNIDVMEEMRKYVETYSREGYMKLEEL